MSAFRFSIARLLMVVAIFSFGIVALVNSSAFWASLLMTLVVSVLFFSICKAAASKGANRGFWVSFALCGWAYLHLVFGAFLPSLTDPLLTTRSLAWIHSQMLSQPLLTVGAEVLVESEQVWYPAKILEMKGDQYRVHYAGYSAGWDEWVESERIRQTQPNWEAFQQIGHGIWALLVASIAGLTARWSFDREHGRYAPSDGVRPSG